MKTRKQGVPRIVSMVKYKKKYKNLQKFIEFKINVCTFYGKQS